jgi:hypothetical protein
VHAGRSNWPPKTVGLAPADMTRLPPSIIPTKKFSSKQPRLLAGTSPTLNLPCFTREIVHFLLIHSPSSSYLDFYVQEFRPLQADTFRASEP